MHEINTPQMPDLQIPSARSEGGTSPRISCCPEVHLWQRQGNLPGTQSRRQGPFTRGRPAEGPTRGQNAAAPAAESGQRSGREEKLRWPTSPGPDPFPQPRQAPTPTRRPSGAEEATAQHSLTSSKHEKPPARAERRKEADPQHTAKPQPGTAHLPADVATFRAAPRACARGDGRGVKLHVAANPAPPLRGRGDAGKGRGGMWVLAGTSSHTALSNDTLRGKRATLFRGARPPGAPEGCGRCTCEVERGPRLVGVQPGRAQPRDVRSNVENGQEARGCQLIRVLHFCVVVAGGAAAPRCEGSGC